MFNTQTVAIKDPVFPFANTAKDILMFHNLDKSHWGERIIMAENKGKFSLEDYNDSGGWVTCACGKQGDLIEWKVCDYYEDEVVDYEYFIESNSEGGPNDPQLERLGKEFFGAVSCNDFIDAAKTLVNIEHRVFCIGFEKDNPIDEPIDYR